MIVKKYFLKPPTHLSSSLYMYIKKTLGTLRLAIAISPGIPEDIYA